MAATKSLGTLVTDAVEFCKQHLAVLLIGAAVFGAAQMAIGYWFVGSQMPYWQQSMESWKQTMEGGGSEMRDLVQKVQSGEGTPEDMQRMQQLSGAAGMTSTSGMMTGGRFWMSIMPSLGIMFFLSLLVGLVAKSYYLMVAVKGVNDVGAAVNMTIASITQLVGLWLWMALRSFIWIPIIGPFIAIFIGPRLILSPLYMLEQGKGITESVRMSYGATEGFWGKIVGNAIVVGLCGGILTAIVSGILKGILGYQIGDLVGMIISQILAAFGIVFMILLARTVMATRETT